MATYNGDGTTDYVPGESNDRAVVNPDAKHDNGGDHASEHTAPVHAATPGHHAAPPPKPHKA